MFVCIASRLGNWREQGRRAALEQYSLDTSVQTCLGDLFVSYIDTSTGKHEEAVFPVNLPRQRLPSATSTATSTPAAESASKIDSAPLHPLRLLLRGSVAHYTSHSSDGDVTRDDASLPTWLWDALEAIGIVHFNRELETQAIHVTREEDADASPIGVAEDVGTLTNMSKEHEEVWTTVGAAQVPLVSASRSARLALWLVQFGGAVRSWVAFERTRITSTAPIGSRILFATALGIELSCGGVESHAAQVSFEQPGVPLVVSPDICPALLFAAAYFRTSAAALGAGIEVKLRNELAVVAVWEEKCRSADGAPLRPIKPSSTQGDQKSHAVQSPVHRVGSAFASASEVTDNAMMTPLWSTNEGTDQMPLERVSRSTFQQTCQCQLQFRETFLSPFNIATSISLLLVTICLFFVRQRLRTLVGGLSYQQSTQTRLHITHHSVRRSLHPMISFCLAAHAPQAIARLTTLQRSHGKWKTPQGRETHATASQMRTVGVQV